jgi:pimeloyl-ACP methyl ester carboxylesterase
VSADAGGTRDPEADGSPFTTRHTVTRAGVDLAVWEGGNVDGPTIAMVHGWPDTHHLWHRVAALLATDFRVVAYDTRGQGESPTDAGDEAFTVDELAADLFAVLDAVSPDAPVHLLGHDWGSIQAWAAVCADRAEQRVASFTSMSGPHLDHTAEWVRDRLRHPSPRGVAELAAQAVSSAYVPFLVSPLAPPVLRVLGGRERWRRLLRATEGLPPGSAGHASSVGRDMVSGLRYYRANLLGAHARGASHEADPDGSGGRSTRVPVLQLVLTRDLAVRGAPLTGSDRWTEHLERVALPYGHWIALTHPEVVAEETARFVRAVESQRGR